MIGTVDEAKEKVKTAKPDSKDSSEPIAKPAADAEPKAAPEPQQKVEHAADADES